ncbi:hypothetical protein A2755_01380 [Candidatus Wolfebacteria bacterium RIFCSPHIGHO2_01_FULL_48_22]|nr:MAG: hypothetical protein A2755_01380 [Candidatus Wolfebacteria bacterium RIFCSPHIGHO2_01_FULL_48_22]
MIRFAVYLICIAAIAGAYATYGGESQTASVRDISTYSHADISGHAYRQAGESNYCTSASQLYDSQDVLFCSQIPKLDRFRLFEIDLSRGRILFYEHGVLKKTFPVAYQAAYGKWFQTPTGYFEAGVKKPKFKSSIVPVYMEDAVQLYEDFFIHGIPYYEDGTRVTSQFSGGCIRLEDDIASDFYHEIQRGDSIVSYTTLAGLVSREGTVQPVEQDRFWVRQRFNSPLKVDWTWREDTAENYIQHTGIDLAPPPAGGSGAVDFPAYAVADGTVVQVVRNGQGDRGLGNTVLLSHTIDGMAMYGLYAHLDSIDPAMYIGAKVNAGDVVGVIGNSGYGCDFWRVGEDGCDSTNEPDTHLHLEFKTEPVLDAPVPDPACGISAEVHSCVGSTSEDPILFGYLDPMEVLFK